jgi:signal transduction histidine kinase
MGRWTITVGLSALAIATGVFTLDVARDHPGYWFADSTDFAGVALLAAGWTLVACGLVEWLRRPESRFGPLLAAAGFAWFLLEWNNPGIDSPLAFTIGLALYASCAPLVAHAVLAYPGGQLGSRLERAAVVLLYAACVLGLGVLPALVFDPRMAGCAECPRNLLVVTDHGALADDLIRAGIYLGLAAALGVSALTLVKLARASSAARLMLAAGAVYLGLVAASLAVSLDRGFLTHGTLERRLWLAQAAALVVVAVGVVWAWARARRARFAVARLVVDLARSPPAGGLRDVLAEIVGDRDLVLAYPLGDPDRLVDARGRAVELTDDREQTSLVRDGRTVAVLAHEPGLLHDEQLVHEVTGAARLALENERLQAEVRARLDELRASRARIVQAGDAERKGLERDLHDGAQQRLVGLSLSLRLFRSQLTADADAGAAERLESAEAELRSALTELRDLAHGIFPAVLADDGLASAVEALAEEGHVPIRIRDLPEGRFAPPVETAAYTVVAEAARAAAEPLDVEATRADGLLVVEVELDDDASLDLIALEDRVGALDGRLSVARDGTGRLTIRAELPCGS